MLSVHAAGTPHCIALILELTSPSPPGDTIDAGVRFTRAIQQITCVHQSIHLPTHEPPIRLSVHPASLDSEHRRIGQVFRARLWHRARSGDSGTKRNANGNSEELREQLQPNGGDPQRSGLRDPYHRFAISVSLMKASGNGMRILSAGYSDNDDRLSARSTLPPGLARTEKSAWNDL